MSKCRGHRTRQLIIVSVTKGLRDYVIRLEIAGIPHVALIIDVGKFFSTRSKIF